MKILNFPKHSTNMFSVILFYATVQNFRLQHATVLDMTLKGLLCICFQWSLFLVGKAYLGKADAYNHKKKISTRFFYKKIFYKKMSLKNPKTLRNC